MKRFQECNWLVKLWRYRWYILIPFKYIWFMYLKPLIVMETYKNDKTNVIEDTGKVYNPRGKELWGILKGLSQSKMNWYYTSDEVSDYFKMK